jgi:predicted dehydrogenase
VNRPDLPRVAVIGAGRWGRNIVRTLADLGVLCGVADASEDNRERIKSSHIGVPVHADMKHVLADPNVDAVAIATPVKMHFDHAMQALSAGKHVFVEKPMTATFEEAETLVEAAQKRDRTLMVGHLLLYQPVLQNIQQILKTGELGRPFAFHQVRKNLGTVRLLENALYSLGVHDLAVLTYLSGSEPQGVTVNAHSMLNEGIADDVDVHLHYRGNLQAHLSVSWLWPEKERRLIIKLEHGFLVYDEITQLLTRYGCHAKNDGTLVSGPTEVVASGDSQPLRYEMEHFVECVADGGTPRSNGEHGAKVMRLLSRIDEQLRNASEELIGSGN